MNSHWIHPPTHLLKAHNHTMTHFYHAHPPAPSLFNGQVEECRAPHSRQTVDLLRAAHEGLLRGGGSAGSAPGGGGGAGTSAAGRGAAKSLHHISLLLGQEMLEGGDPRGARALLEEVAGEGGIPPRFPQDSHVITRS